MKKLFFLSLIVLSLISCTDVRFVNPQPEFVDPLQEIPAKYHGEFLINRDTHIVTKNTIDDKSISFDSSVVVKERGDYFYINTLDDYGYYQLRIIRSVNFLDYENITLYATKSPELSQERLFEIVDRLGDDKEIPVLDNVSVNQLSVLNSSSKTYKVLRLK